MTDVTYTYASESLQYFVVPAGVTSLYIDARGGADTLGGSYLGGVVTGNLPVSAGQTLTIEMLYIDFAESVFVVVRFPTTEIVVSAAGGDQDLEEDGSATYGPPFVPTLVQNGANNGAAYVLITYAAGTGPPPFAGWGVAQ